MTSVDGLLAQLEVLRKALAATSTKQVKTTSVKAHLHDTATKYFTEVQPALGDYPAEKLNEVFQALHVSSRMAPSVQRCRDLVKEARKLLIALEGQTLATPRRQPSASPTDTLIVGTLNEVCPSASLAYQQALADFSRGERLSWRGPATDLREAMRETLDVLAPDAELLALPGFKLEGDQKRPTMKQKVRYILKTRGTPHGAMETPEHAVVGVEDLVGGLARTVYTRSSVSTHTATTHEEAARVHAWVRLVLCELLELPLS